MMTKEPSTTIQLLEKEYLIRYPNDAARSLEGKSIESILKHLRSLPIQHARAIFFRLNSDLQASLVSTVDDAFFKELFEGVNTHLAAVILSRLEKERS